jgi:hypothetical protein
MSMLKIGQKIASSISRYERKNTVSAKFERCINRAELLSVATGVQLCRLPAWEPASDIAITSFLGTLVAKNLKDAFALVKDLKGIKKRALSIRKAARLNNK